MAKYRGYLQDGNGDILLPIASAVEWDDILNKPNIGTTNDYEDLDKKPSINNVTLIGNKNSKDLDLQSTMYELTNLEIEDLLK